MSAVDKDRSCIPRLSEMLQVEIQVGGRWCYESCKQASFQVIGREVLNLASSGFSIWPVAERNMKRSYIRVRKA